MMVAYNSGKSTFHYYGKRVAYNIKQQGKPHTTYGMTLKDPFNILRTSYIGFKRSQSVSHAHACAKFIFLYARTLPLAN